VFAKLIVVIVSLALLGCALLSIRQSRMQAAHDLARTRLRLAEHDASLWVLRARIADRVTPMSIRAMAESLGPIEPITPASRLSAMAPEADLAASNLAAPGGTIP
jgi:hypothetical protein